MDFSALVISKQKLPKKPVYESTVGRFGAINSRRSGYYPEQAHRMTANHRHLAKKCKKIMPTIELSHERIYQFVLADKEKGETLYLYLRDQYKKYDKHYHSLARNRLIKNGILIDERQK